MYKIIGADQREYGPVDVDKVRQWILQGRADGQTKVRIEGTEDWKCLADLPEFADLVVRRPPPLEVPPRFRGDGDRLAEEIRARDYRIYAGDCFSRSWTLIRDHFWLLVGTTTLMVLLFFGIGSVPVLGCVAGLLLSFVLWGGVGLVFLKLSRGESADVGTAFAGFSVALVPLMLAGLISEVLTSVGLLFCILPGIYLLVAWWMFTPLLILDKGLDFWQAMECSRRVVSRHWWTCFGLLLLSALVSLAGLLACGVGALFTLAIAIGAIVYAYEDIFNPPTPPAVAQTTGAGPTGPTGTPPAGPAEAHPAAPAPSPALIPEETPATSAAPAQAEPAPVETPDNIVEEPPAESIVREPLAEPKPSSDAPA
jgi:hypothetical protein